MACLTFVDDSYAARMGGGRSFGSQPTMRSPAVAPRPAQQQPYRNPATQSAPRPATAPMGGMGAMGGLFGGLLAGTLLGSLLGGGGAAGAGGGIGFIDIILFGLVIWLGLKFFRRMHQGNAPQAETRTPFQQPYADAGPNAYNDVQASPSAWDRLRNAAQDGSSVGGFGAPQVPAGFDTDEFLQGAKAAYVRMQSSWDQRDLNDIALFATPAVMDVLREQMREDPNPSSTELVSISAQLMGVANEGQLQRAQVYFDVLMREDPKQLRPEPAREIWHFVRTLPDGTWKLDGIQQAM